MTTVLVTGASGNVGREVVRACLAAGFKVKAAGIAQTRDAAVPSVHLDFTDQTTWALALEGIDFVFLLRPPPLGDMAATLNPFVDAAFSKGVKHLVFLSVSGAETKSWVPHRKVEDHLKTTHGHWTVLRPGFFAQNLADAYRRDVVEENRLFVPASLGRVAFLDVADIGDVVAHIFRTPECFRSTAIRLAGPEAITFEQLAARLSAVLGRRITYVPASILGYAWHLWRHRSLPLMQILVQTVLHVGLRGGDAEAIDDRQLELLGRPAHTVDGYLERARQAWLVSAR